MARGYTGEEERATVESEEGGGDRACGWACGAQRAAPLHDFLADRRTCWKWNWLAADHWGHWVWRAASMSGSSKAPRHLAVQSWVEVRPLAPRRSAPDKVALRMSASRRTAPVRNAPCKSAPLRSASSRMAPFIWAPPSLDCAIFADERSVCVRFAKES